MRLPLTLRLMFYSLRSAMVAASITLLGWVIFVPASAAERAALKSGIGVEWPDGLTEMRIARAMVHFAPDRAARMLSRASKGELSPELAGMILRQIAAGPASAEPPAPEPRTGGAKFVPAERP